MAQKILFPRNVECLLFHRADAIGIGSNDMTMSLADIILYKVLGTVAGSDM